MNRFLALGLCAAAAGSFVAAPSLASNIVPSNFNGYGTSVSGFQDFFTESSLSASNYTEISAGGAVTPGSSGNFTLPGDGTLHINGGGGDPNKLLYSGQSYNSSNQNVLAMIEVTGASTGGDGFRGGVAAQSSSTNGQGINVLFRADGNNGSGQHMNFLNDGLAWGPAFDQSPGGWSTNTYYWVRETTDSSGNITGEIWPADGVTPESSAISSTWTQGGRSGLAGLVADSNNGNATFKVNYLLIQSAGLSTVTAGVTPEPASLGLIGLGAIGLLSRRRVGAR